MKYSVKLLLYSHQANALGQFPIYIRITINRKQSYISTGHFIDKKYWDEKAEKVKAGHMQAATINPDITSRKQALIKIIVDHQVKGQQITSAAFVIAPALMAQPMLHSSVFCFYSAPTIRNVLAHPLFINQKHRL